MRIKTYCRPFSLEHTSMVDLVRRGDPPPYARSDKWINWADPGGILWAFVWIRIAALLFIFYALTAAYGPPPRGLPYPLPEKQLRQVDLTRLLGGQPVLGRNGRPVIDPTASNVSIFAIRGGTSELKWQSVATRQGVPTVYILLPEAATTYQDVVSNVEAIRRDHADVTIWLAPSPDRGVQPN